jgi:predicted Rossmann-fold nucleotide-binding protein
VKVIIAGGRDFKPMAEDVLNLNQKHLQRGFTEVVCGGARGADSFGCSWAESLGIPVKVISADWDKHGKAEGPLRNREMAAYADAVILFPGGRGTESMYREAKAAGLRICDWRETCGGVT